MRLIDADALEEKLQALAERYAKQGRIEVAKDYSFVATVIMAAPTIEAEPVRHGRWVDCRPHLVVECSECKGKWYGHPVNMNHCPNCGAKMDLEVSNDES